MEAKLIEIRDKGTFIAAIAVALTLRELPLNDDDEFQHEDRYTADVHPNTEKAIAKCRLCREEGNDSYRQERYLLRRAGYSADRIAHDALEPYILLTDLTGERPCNYDAFSWTNRTWHFAHLYLLANWSKVRSGDVIDVEYILNETAAKKQSERVTVGDYA